MKYLHDTNKRIDEILDNVESLLTSSREEYAQNLVHTIIHKTEEYHISEIVCFKEGLGINLHSHPDSNEIIICISGEVNFYTDTRTIKLFAGDSVHIETGEPHGGRAVTVPVKLITVCVPSDYTVEIFNKSLEQLKRGEQ